MNRAFLIKTIRDARWLLIGCVATLFAFAWIRVLIVASMEAGKFQKIARNLPDMVKRLSPVPIDELISYPGLIGFTFEEPLTYLIMAIWTVSRCSDSVSGELGRGTLEMLLAQPISRTKYLLGHTLITIIGIGALAGAVYEGTHAGIRTAQVEVPPPSIRWQVPMFGFKLPVGRKGNEPKYLPMTKFVKPRVYRAATINYFCFGLFLAGLTTACSSVDRYRWRTVAIVVSFYICQTIIEVAGMAVEGLRWLLHFTFFAAYEPVRFSTRVANDAHYQWRFFEESSFGVIPDLGPLGCDVVLAGLGIIGFVFAFVAFQRRDLPAPL